MTRRIRLTIDGRKLDDYGIGTTIRTLLEALGTQPDFAVTLLTARELSPAEQERFGQPVVVRSELRGYTAGELLLLGRQLRATSPEVVYLPHFVAPLYLPEAPLVVTVHDPIHLLFPEYYPSRAKRWLVRWLMRRALGGARLALTVSEGSARDLRRLFPEHTGRLRVLHNDIPPELLRAAELPPGPSPLDSAYFLAVGNFLPHKNILSLLRAFECLSEDNAWGTGPAPRLVLVGGTLAQAGQRCPELAGYAAGRPWLVEAGRVSTAELAGWYRHATALVAPSRYEGFGLPAAEALAFGTPVLHAATGGLPEVVGPGGWALSGLDTEAIARGLVEVWLAPAERLRRGELGREHVLRHFQGNAARLVGLLREVANANGS